MINKLHSVPLSVFVTSGFMLAILVAVFLSGPVFAHAATLNRELEIGMTGDDVSALQTFLAKDKTIYPQGLVTGYFGFLTKAAVSNFQARNGISTVGRVGPITLAAINGQMANGAGGDVSGPILSPISVSTASSSVTLSWNTNEVAKGVVYYATTPLSEYEMPGSVSISGNVAMTDTALRNSQSVTIWGLTSNTKYYYDVYVTDAFGNVSMTNQTTFQTTY